MKKIYLLLVILATISVYANAQTQPEKKTYTKEQVLALSYEQLLNLPFEELLQVAEVVGVSTDELLEMILNKELTSAS